MMKLKAFGRTLLTTGIVVGLGFSQAALATTQSDTDDLTVQVELAAGLSLSCTVLNFGRVSVDTSLLEGNATVHVQTPSFPSTSASSASAGIVPLEDSSPATCTVSGFRNMFTTLTVIANDAAFTEVGTAALTAVSPGEAGAPTTAFNDSVGTSSFNGLPVDLTITGSASTLNAQSSTNFLTTPETLTTSAGRTIFNGDAGNITEDIIFTVGGTLVIPDSFSADNLGKYTGTITLTVEETDVTP